MFTAGAVLQCLRLLGGLTAVRNPPEQLLPGRTWPGVAPNAAAVVLEMQATSMVRTCTAHHTAKAAAVKVVVGNQTLPAQLSGRTVDAV